MKQFIITSRKPMILGIMERNTAMANIKTQEVNYQAGDMNLRGYISWDEDFKGKGPGDKRLGDRRPGVLVVHEFWGNNEYPRKRAEMLAALGYTAMAIDLYGDGKTVDHPQEAQQLMAAALADLPACRARFDAALARLKAQSTVDAQNIAAIGYCLGGGIVLHMARFGADLKAVASFHGSLPLALAPEARNIRVTARVVAYNGEDDPFFPPDAIAAFKQEMEQAGADYQFINFPATLHSFSNPAATAKGEKYQLPLKYNALADQGSWSHMQLLFQSVFK
jgi:dienelactone hydrolase